MTGGGRSPRQSCRRPSDPPPSSSSVVCPDTFNDHVEILLNVREMRQRLLQHVETLRLKLQADEENFSHERHRLLQQQQLHAEAKDTEIETFRARLAQHDDKMNQLNEDNTRKERAISQQLAAVEQLRTMLQQVTNRADRIHKQFMPDHSQMQTARVHEPQSKECSHLGQETQLLKQQLAEVAQEFPQITKTLQETYEEMRALHAENTTTLNQVLAIKDILSLQRRESGAPTEHPPARTASPQSVHTETRSTTAAAAGTLQETYEEMRALHAENTATLNQVLAIKDILSLQRRESGAPTEHPPARTTSPQSVHTETQSTTAAAPGVGHPMTSSRSITDCMRGTMKALPLCVVKTGVLHTRQTATRGQVRKGITLNKT